MAQVSEELGRAPAPAGKAAKALHMAALLGGDSKGDHQATARVLDRLLASDDPLTSSERFTALVLRADVAVHMEEWASARDFIAEARSVPPVNPSAHVDDLRRLDDLEGFLPTN